MIVGSFISDLTDVIKYIPSDVIVMLIPLSVIMIVVYISGLAICFLSIVLGQ